MSDYELCARAGVAAGHIEVDEDFAGTSPEEWYTIPLWIPKRWRRLQENIGIILPVPYTVYAGVCQTLCEDIGTSYEPEMTPRQNAEAALVYHDTATA